MKRLEEMGREELINLTDEQTEALIDLECAYRGIPISIEAPVYKDVPEIPPEDVTYYSVEGINLLDRAEAVAFSEAVNALKSRCAVERDYSLPGFNRYTHIKPDYSTAATEISTDKTYSYEKYAELKDAIRARASAEETNKQIRNLFQKANQSRDSVIDEVYEAIRRAYDEEREIAEKAKSYNRYRELAGDDTVAFKFYVDRFGGGEIPPEVYQEAERQRVQKESEEVKE